MSHLKKILTSGASSAIRPGRRNRRDHHISQFRTDNCHEPEIRILRVGRTRNPTSLLRRLSEDVRQT